MATFDSGEENILDGETVNWRLIVYPILVVIVLLVGGVALYLYQMAQSEQHEADARAVLIKAKTVDEMLKVADQFPGTTQATLALMRAGQTAYGKQDYDAAIKAYQSVMANSDADKLFYDTAQLGIAASLEGQGKVDDAIKTYLVIGDLGDKSPYAPFAFHSAARLYEQKGDKENQRKVLLQVSSLDPNSAFVQAAQYKLKEMNAASALNPQNITPPAAPTNAAPVVPAPPPAAPPTPSAKPDALAPASVAPAKPH